MNARSASKRGASKARKYSDKKVGISAIPGWLWLLLGLAGGFCAAFLFRFTPGTVDVRKMIGPPVKTEQATEPSPVFDFYTLLPESEVGLFGTETATELMSDRSGKKENSRQEKRPLANGEKTAQYLLQAGSFRSIKDADRLSSQLIVWGLQAKVEKVTVGNGESWHRVQIGPFEDSEALKNAQQLLVEHDVDSLMLKIR